MSQVYIVQRVLRFAGGASAVVPVCVRRSQESAREVVAEEQVALRQMDESEVVINGEKNTFGSVMGALGFLGVEYVIVEVDDGNVLQVVRSIDHLPRGVG